jgi:stage V sporulation protein R
MRLFHLTDDPEEEEGMRVAAIHDERGYRRIRRELGRQYDIGWIDPHIEVVDVDLEGDRRLFLRHLVLSGSVLEESEAKRVLQHLADLWTYDVVLEECDRTGMLLKQHVVSPREVAIAAA